MNVEGTATPPASPPASLFENDTADENDTMADQNNSLQKLGDKIAEMKAKDVERRAKERKELEEKLSART